MGAGRMDIHIRTTNQKDKGENHAKTDYKNRTDNRR